MDRWAWLGLGLCSFGCLLAFFGLVGWATYRATQLDDPQHPYLGNP